MLDGAWYVVLRDIFIILAAASIVTLSVFAAIVLWQLYRLAIEVRDEAQPIIESVETTAKTVQGSADVVGSRAVPPAAAAIGVSAGAFSIYRQLEQFYRGLRRVETPTVRIEDPDAGGASGSVAKVDPPAMEG